MKRLLLVVIGTVMIVSAGYPQQTLTNPVAQGLNLFQQGNYREALAQFRQVLSDPGLVELRGDAYFWTAKTLVALERYGEADQNLEFFLTRHPENRNIPEAEYLRGRIHFLEKSYEAAIQVFAAFVKDHQRSPFVPNAYYWTGESLFSLGRYDEAEVFFTVIVDRFQASSRYEAARYRIDVITMKKREQELLTLLQWVQEESIKNLNEFRIREATYEQAISSQGTGGGSTQGGADPRVQALNTQIAQLKEEALQTESRLRALNNDYQRVLTNLEVSQRRISELELQLENSEISPSGSEAETLRLRSELLDLKEETLQLMLDLLEAQEE